jgi:uncharacterized protein YodC (DUF2158 family)
VKRGDLVKLKSGGPAMVVSRVCNEPPCNFVSCEWFDYSGVHHMENFHPEILGKLLVKASKAKAGRRG